MLSDYQRGVVDGLVKAKEIMIEYRAKCERSAEIERDSQLKEAYKGAAWVYGLAADYIQNAIDRETED